MLSSIFFTALGGLALATAQAPTPIPGTTGQLGNAAVVQGNPSGVTYQAILPNSPKTGVRGYVAGTSNKNGTGVTFNVNIYGLPDASLGPFLYHIHDQPVPSDGNCSGTKAHLDPYIRGEKPPCDSKDPASCQVGDLAGKHGNITSNPFQRTYLDLYLSTAKGPESFFGNRSIVIHTSNTTRLTCANFTLVAGTPSNSTSPKGTASGSGGSGPSPTTTSPPFTGGAAAKVISVGAALAGIVALAL